MFNNCTPKSAPSRSRSIRITVISDSVEVVTDQSTELYPCLDEHQAHYYALHLRKMYRDMAIEVI